MKSGCYAEETDFLMEPNRLENRIEFYTNIYTVCVTFIYILYLYTLYMDDSTHIYYMFHPKTQCVVTFLLILVNWLMFSHVTLDLYLVPICDVVKCTN